LALSAESWRSSEAEITAMPAPTLARFCNPEAMRLGWTSPSARRATSKVAPTPPEWQASASTTTRRALMKRFSAVSTSHIGKPVDAMAS